MIGRYRDGDPTAIEAFVERAIRAALADAGYTIRPEGGTDSYVVTSPDGADAWLEFAVSERPIIEPVEGTPVMVWGEGCWRNGVVRFRGPGFFVVAWRYKNGADGSTTVTATGGPSWRHVDVPATNEAAEA
jgi:hypothetical protein